MRVSTGPSAGARIRPFIERLARPHVVPLDIEASYRDMASDQSREQDALEWSEGLIADSSPRNPMLRGEVWWVDFDPRLAVKFKRHVPPSSSAMTHLTANLNRVQGRSDYQQRDPRLPL